ncbi:MAG: GIY-YIG nuclease family protein [Bacteroidales bacterium]|nr:GIY-YIG nuclease family protein [Bacteroidales bacterium]
MPYYVYIIESEEDHRYYYGQTKDLEKRLTEHNLGKSAYTRKYTPWKLYACKITTSRSEAMKYERMLKNIHSREKVLKFIRLHDFEISE